MAIPDGEKKIEDMFMGLFVLTQLMNVTDRQTLDRQTHRNLLNCHVWHVIVTLS